MMAHDTTEPSTADTANMVDTADTALEADTADTVEAIPKQSTSAPP